ncbi:hypothetical protein N657DRAFT_686064 [Parathielavia appendiculata]|uniref:Alpha/beta-hydrolase n=1 Tax=Parathielavia appendiculata TaxID=2587402 RepID=A0AAN6U8R8_9PEZI|nr:hypothetical protein N657DRAFT_686064 [Parathielavia appendiculata]
MLRHMDRMSRWLRFSRGWLVAQAWNPRLRLLSTRSSVEHVRVPCASSGDITVSLYNIAKHNSTIPLIIFIPPFSQPAEQTPLPSCFQDYPTAVINYRWLALEGDDRREGPLYWPTPLHDISFGYSWIKDNLGAGTDVSTTPRAAYVHGSYLGATLAAALALTESYVPVTGHSMTIRGLIAQNGIYNWTMFLPDHPIHAPKPMIRRKKQGLLSQFLREHPERPTTVEEEGIFTDLKHQMPALFSTPDNLFDPFASPCLFFHSPNVHVPDDFTTPLTATATSSLPSNFMSAVDALANHSSSPSSDSDPNSESESAEDLLESATLRAKLLKPPRKGYLTYPPLSFSSNTGPVLRIPPTLLLYSTPQHHNLTRSSSSSRQTALRNSFAAQARELAGLMLRSVDMYELSGHGRYGRGRERDNRHKGTALQVEEEWGQVVEDPDDDGGRKMKVDWERRRELERRVQTFEISPSQQAQEERGGLRLGLDDRAEEVVREWLSERIEEDFGGDGDDSV